jgi:hypothetical protein
LEELHYTNPLIGVSSSEFPRTQTGSLRYNGRNKTRKPTVCVIKGDDKHGQRTNAES